MAAKKSSTIKKIETVQNDAVLASVKGLKVEDAIKEIGSAQVTVQQVLAELSSVITDRITQLNNVDAAIVLKEAQLKDLHSIETSAITLDDLNTQIEDARATVAAEENAAYIAETERTNELAKARKREQEEYNYATNIARKKAQDEFEASIAQAKRLEAVRVETLNKTWSERENVLKAKEQEVTDLRVQVAGFPEVLKKEVAKETAIVGNVLKKDHTAELALVRKDAETEKRVSDAALHSANATIDGLKAQIAAMQLELVTARQDAKEVAAKALEATSKSQLAETLQRVVENKDSNQQKSNGR